MNTGQESPRPPKLLDRVRDAIRTRHYSRETEKAYVAWTREFVRHPKGLGVDEVRSFLTRLAVNRRVAPSTQNQALAAHALRAEAPGVQSPLDRVA